MEAPAVVQADVLMREFIQLYSYAEPIARGDSFKTIGYGFREGLAVYKHDSPEKSIAGNTKTVFGFEVEHVFSPEPAADITSAEIFIGIGLGRRQQKIGRMVVEVEDVIGPKRQGIV